MAGLDTSTTVHLSSEAFAADWPRISRGRFLGTVVRPM